MAKFPEAEAVLMSVKVCHKCKSRNPKTATKCRKCGYRYLRGKKKGKGGKGAAGGAAK
ncbi:MAG: 50S ribosomal protein L40e [Candidatus Micrarchaeota archaeon]|nr:50S ribosomal protein L40e [Candidatus Micrarchaeota archaeon]